MDNNFNPEYVPIEPVDNKKGIAITILVLGIVADVLCLSCSCAGCISIYLAALDILPLICAVVGLVLYLVNKNSFGANAAKLAKAGFICSVVSLVVGVVYVIALIVFAILAAVGFVGLGVLSGMSNMYY